MHSVAVVGAGIGRFLLEDLAARLDRPYQDFASLVSGDDAVRDRAAHCAPATRHVRKFQS